jgi:hypothetical protein
VRAALKMPSKRSVNDPLVLIVIEVKKRRDKESEDYKSKLKEVDAIYNRNGFFFFIIEEEVDLNSIDCSHLPSILMDETLVVPQDVIQIALDFLRNADGVTTYAAMMDVLGGGPRGREITNYLHIKGIIWADLSNNPLMREDITRVAMPPIIGAKRQAMAQLARMAA